MNAPRPFASLAFPISLSIAAGLVLSLSCGGGGGGGASGMGTVDVSLSDPPTCKAPNGDFKHAWVTVTKVRAHISSLAPPQGGDHDDDDDEQDMAGGNGNGDHDEADDDHNDDDHGNDGKWVTLVDLTQHPKQIDLLSAADTTCMLANLGLKQGVPAGKYQQIRFHLLPNNVGPMTPTPAVNNCQGVGGFNCVDTVSVGLQLLLLGGNPSKGFKIPPGQIAGGALNVAHGQKVDLNIDFDACKSIVKQGNGKYRLKPTLHAGEVEVNKGVVTGRLVDAANGQPLTNGRFFVLAEQPDAAGNYRVVAQKLIDPSGATFNLCPLAIGQYAFVFGGTDASGAAYGPSVLFGVPTSTGLGDIPLHKVPGPSADLARIDGVVSTSTSASTATGADVEVVPMQSATPPGGSATLVTVPSLDGSSTIVATESGLACSAGTKCAGYSLFVAAGNPSVATFNSAGTFFAPPAGGDVPVSVSARAFVPGTQVLNCNPSTLIVSDDNGGATLVVTPGGMKIAGTIPFTGCTSGF